MKRRCEALLDYNDHTALRCQLEWGHTGIHQTGGWERRHGSTDALVRRAIERLTEDRRTGS